VITRAPSYPAIADDRLTPERPRRPLTMPELRRLHETWDRSPGIMGWLASTNHKDVAMRYIVSSFVFFALAGALALMMRLQLALPGLQVLSPDRYNQFFSTHGTAMMFLFAVPVMLAMGGYMVPLMIGTRNVALPRLNSFGFYTFLISGVFLFVSLILNTGPDAGWFGYVPLTGPQYTPGKRADVWSQMISLNEISALVSAVEIIVTVFKQRAVGMALSRMPVFVWAMLVTSFMVLFAMPSVMLGTSMITLDRMAHVNTQFFNPAEGGDVLLYQHMFWFFGHPEVYIIFLPATGFISEMVQAFTGRRLFGYTAVVLSLISTGFISFGLWVHHMFATPVPRLGEAFFTGASEMIAIPSGIQVFCWIATIWLGRPRLRVPMLYALGFLALFVLGGLTGIMLAAVSLDTQEHDSMFVVAHLHYVLIGGSVFPLLGAITYWYPKFTGRMMHEGLGVLTFWLAFIGFNTTFFPLHILGLHGMTRRGYTYLPETGWGPLNLIATIGSFALGAAVLLFVVNALASRWRGRHAGADPWGGAGLEWLTLSPPARYNFAHPPVVRSRTPLWDDPEPPVVVGCSIERREAIITTVLDAKPQHRYEFAGDSLWPLLLALAVGWIFIGAVFTPWSLPTGAVFLLIFLAGWFWRDTEPWPLFGSSQKHRPSGEEETPHEFRPQEPVLSPGGRG
jgi:cytochrome c oxidase subunit I+III